MGLPASLFLYLFSSYLPFFSNHSEFKESLLSGAHSLSQIFMRYVKASENSSFTPSY